jgi:hypothetical protein
MGQRSARVQVYNTVQFYFGSFRPYACFQDKTPQIALRLSSRLPGSLMPCRLLVPAFVFDAGCFHSELIATRLHYAAGPPKMLKTLDRVFIGFPHHRSTALFLTKADTENNFRFTRPYSTISDPILGTNSTTKQGTRAQGLVLLGDHKDHRNVLELGK